MQHVPHNNSQSVFGAQHPPQPGPAQPNAPFTKVNTYVPSTKQAWGDQYSTNKQPQYGNQCQAPSVQVMCTTSPSCAPGPPQHQHGTPDTGKKSQDEEKPSTAKKVCTAIGTGLLIVLIVLAYIIGTALSVSLMLSHIPPRLFGAVLGIFAALRTCSDTKREYTYNNVSAENESKHRQSTCIMEMCQCGFTVIGWAFAIAAVLAYGIGYGLFFAGFFLFGLMYRDASSLIEAGETYLQNYQNGFSTLLLLESKKETVKVEVYEE